MGWNRRIGSRFTETLECDAPKALVESRVLPVNVSLNLSGPSGNRLSPRGG